MTQTEIDDILYDFLYYVKDKVTKNISIRSGGQTGADEAGAKAGAKLGLKTHIYAPAKWRYRTFGMDIYDEIMFKNRFGDYQKKIQFFTDKSTGYKDRTIVNANADVTIAFAFDFSTSGEKLTKSSALKQGRKFYEVDLNDYPIIPEKYMREFVELVNSIDKDSITINIAGNGIYTLSKYD